MASCLQTLTNCLLSSRANRKKTNCSLSNQKLCHLKHVLMVRYNFYFEGEQIQDFGSALYRFSGLHYFLGKLSKNYKYCVSF